MTVNVDRGVVRGDKASTFLVWLARHRNRLQLAFVGSSHFFLIVGFDRGGDRPTAPYDDEELDAMRMVVYGRK